MYVGLASTLHFVLFVSFRGILAPSRTQPIIERHACGVSVRTLLTPILKLFNAILAAVVPLVKKSLHWYTFLALSVFEGVLLLKNRWDDLLSCCGPAIATDKNEVMDAILSLRSLPSQFPPNCLRT